MLPNLDLVAGDMATIVQQLLNAQPMPSAPTTAATPTPGPNVHGWNNEDVAVTLTATAGPGRTVTEIEYSLAGAQTTGPTVHQGDAVDVLISAEGDTTLTFFARDDGGTVEAPRQLAIRLDKTPPSVFARASPAPNASGWNNTDVTVSFSATDTLSGVDTVGAPTTLTAEGAAQEAGGTATDLADNASVAAATVSIDKTPPVLAGMPDPGCLLWPPNGRRVEVASVTPYDALSGVAPGTLDVTATSSEADTGSGGAHAGDIVIAAEGTVLLRAERIGAASSRTYTVTASVRDAAGNASTATGSCVVPHDRRR
jgi:hypothetical protein